MSIDNIICCRHVCGKAYTRVWTDSLRDLRNDFAGQLTARFRLRRHAWFGKIPLLVCHSGVGTKADRGCGRANTSKKCPPCVEQSLGLGIRRLCDKHHESLLYGRRGNLRASASKEPDRVLQFFLFESH